MSDDLAVLAHAASDSDSRRDNPLWLRGVKYTFITAIEACVDTAQHICASEGWGPPKDNGDAVRLLGLRGVVPPELADRLRQACAVTHAVSCSTRANGALDQQN